MDGSIGLLLNNTTTRAEARAHAQAQEASYKKEKWKKEHDDEGSM